MVSFVELPHGNYIRIAQHGAQFRDAPYLRYRLPYGMASTDIFIYTYGMASTYIFIYIYTRIAQHHVSYFLGTLHTCGIPRTI